MLRTRVDFSPVSQNKQVIFLFFLNYAVCLVKMVRYKHRSLFFALLWTSTWSRSIETQKKRTLLISSHLDLTLGQ